MSTPTTTLQLDAEEPLHGERYPPPLATHDAVVNHSSLFWDTLQKFHSLMGTRFMVPVIGGKDLDLHVLYIEVTKRGGFQKVVLEKKWREISSTFNFSPTTTSASYVLKKHYQGLLLHYEQAYLFKLQAPLLHVTVPSSENDVLTIYCKSNNLVVKVIYFYRLQAVNKLIDLSIIFCSLSTGFIDGKFDCGYLVSVNMGSEILRGILYFPDQPSVSKDIVPYMGGAAGHPNLSNTNIHYTGKPSRSGRRKRRGGDPARPKPNRSGYNFYFAEEHQKLKAQFPEREREFTKMIGASWNNLSAEKKAVYQGIGLKDKERYEKEKKEYIERYKHMQGTSGSSMLKSHIG
ncbi:hypothetical protein QQ045_019813 [Rhodiola kirilowii]